MTHDRLIWKIVLDFVILLCVAFPLLCLLLWAEPYHRGYFENDNSIRYPYKLQTISEVAMGLAGFGLNAANIIIIEIVRDKRGIGIGDKYLAGRDVPGWVWESYVAIGAFLFGGACQQLTSNTAKYTIGRLRPHFMAVCQPVPTNSSRNLLGYIQDYTCTGGDPGLVKEARLSFPSAHSSFAMYSALFFIMYVQVKGKWRGSKLLRHAVQFAVFLGAWYVGISRVSDHMHHWSDVAAGFAIGAVYGVLTFVFLLKPKKYGLPTSWQEAAPPENGIPRPVLSER